MTAGTYELCDRLAGGDPTPALLQRLRSLQLARNQVLLAAVQRRVPGHDAAFHALGRLQRDEPRLMAETLLLPQVGCWAVDSLWRLDHGEEPDLDYLAALAAGAAMRAGRPPGTVPPWLRAGTLVPGLGTVTGSGLVPIPTLDVAEGGTRLSVRLDAIDPYLAGYGKRGRPDPVWWQRELGRAWRVLCERHHGAAETVAEVFTTLVPLESRQRSRPFSATSGWAYGAIALSPPPDPLGLAESLVHEVWHLLLGAVEDMTSLADPDDDRRWYAPWRSDPRPLGALVQGCFANFAITAFWRTECGVPSPRSPGRAETEFAHRRAITFEALTRAAGSGGLTAAGRHLVDGLLHRLSPWLREPLPAAAERRAAELRAAHRARWLAANPGYAL
ncbi:HEXXH motif-containing putative peptide modification protein [Nonomuraea sp. GTA35]|uniref:aKG-HExxH-type peptide beta-hydroxylase n=1 Tax=Nonomuraea sp. GTA35 TaxID=1676746 RepID=UPI0035BFA4D6